MSKDSPPVFKGAFRSSDDEFNGQGKRPVVFDIIAPDGETSLLPGSLKMVLHVNPRTMKFSYTKVIERVQTKGGFVEFHWGEGLGTITFEMATGGFMRLYSGLSNITGGKNAAMDVGGTRRETIAYDKYLDILALYHNNGDVYDQNGNLVFDGQIKVTFDGGTHFGKWASFSVQETAEKPYQFELSGEFYIQQDKWNLRTSQIFADVANRFANPSMPTNAQQAGEMGMMAPKLPGTSDTTASDGLVDKILADEVEAERKKQQGTSQGVKTRKAMAQSVEKARNAGAFVPPAPVPSVPKEEIP